MIAYTTDEGGKSPVGGRNETERFTGGPGPDPTAARGAAPYQAKHVFPI